MPLISLIVAASTNHVIGVDGRLPWHLREDLRHFKAVTTGKPIVMGRKTYASIGRPLPELAIVRCPPSIFDYRYEDFEILGYEAHPHIKAAVAV